MRPCLVSTVMCKLRSDLAESTLLDGKLKI